MAFERKDRVKDQTVSTGTGSVVIGLVAVPGYRTMGAHTSGATIRYLIISLTGTDWEVGQGVWSTTGSTLSRDTVYVSSNAGALVSFNSGTKIVASLPTAQDLNELATLASPAFTGTPVAPTAAPGTNSTQLATTGGLIAERAATGTLTNKTLTAPVINSPTGLLKADVGLSAVDNTSDANKPVSTAQAAADATRLPLTGGTVSGALSVTGGVTATLTGNVTGNLTGNVTGNLTGAVTGNASTATLATTASYLSATQQTNPITGRQASMAMSQDGGATLGSFVCRATGTGDTNFAGMSFYNDAYAIKMGIRADGYFALGGWSRPAYSWYSGPDGGMVAAGNVTSYSDPRLKENIVPIEDALSKIERLTGVHFTWKYGIAHIEVKAGKSDIGILADQVKEVFPEIVTDSIEIDGAAYMTVSYEKLIPVLIQSIKELHARIKCLEAGAMVPK